MMDDYVDIVINYYNPENKDVLLHQTFFAILKYKQNSLVNIILSDGSGFKNTALDEFSKLHGIHYIYSTQKLSFPEGYNQGINYSLENFKSEIILLSANDIFVNNNCISIMRTEMKRDSNIGCLIPYLSNSDLTEQNERYNRNNRLPNGMTLNVNMFWKKDLIQIGLVPEEFSGYFNDMVMFYKLLERQKKILLINANNISHLGKATTTLNSQANLLSDKKIFEDKYPFLKATNKNLNLNYSTFAQNKFEKFIFKILDNTSSKLLTKAILKIHSEIILRFNYVK